MANNDKNKFTSITAANVKEVRNLNTELDLAVENIDEMSKSAQKLANFIADLTGIMEKGTIETQEQLDLTKQESKAAKDVLNVINKQTSGNKLQVILAIGKLKWNRLFANVQDDITKNIYEQYDAQQEQASLMESITESLGAQLPFGRELTKIFSEKTKSTAKIAAGIGIAFSILKKFTGLTAIIGDRFGAIGMTTSEIKSGLLDASVEATKLGFGMDEVARVVDSLTTGFGFGLEESIKLSSSILDTSKALGLSAEEGTNLIGTLSQVAGLSITASDQFAKQGALLAKAEGVAPNVVLKDIAQSSEAIAKFTGVTPENLLKASIMATKLGVNLNTVAKVAEGLLDFQTSIEAQMEASVLIGRQLNFQRARELALDNNIEGAMAEIVSQLGSEAEFTALNAIQRDALAKSIGVTTDELAKFITNQDKARTIGDAMAEQGGFEKLVGRDALDNIAKIMADFQVIGAQLLTSIGPGLSVVAGAMANFSKWVADGVVGFGLIAGLVGTVAAGLAVAAVASIWKTLAQIPYGLGLVAAAGLTTALFTQLTKAKSMASLQDAGITTREGLVNVHPQEAILPIEKLSEIFGEAIAKVHPQEVILPTEIFGGFLAPVPVVVDNTAVASEISIFNDSIRGLKQENIQLRNDMNSYFGFGGLVPKAIGKETVGSISAAQGF